MRELLQWIKNNHPAQYEQLEELHGRLGRHPGKLEDQSIQYITRLIEKHLFDRYSLVLINNRFGYRLFWDTRGLYVSGTFRFVDEVFREAFYLTKWKPLW